MQYTIIAGDYILVNKLSYGARIFDVFSALSGKKVKVSRIYGLSNVKHNDVVVFNTPYPNNSSKIKMDMMSYYVKRCFGTPGDTISIKNVFYKTTSSVKTRKIITEIPKMPYSTTKKDTTIDWIIKTFGSCYIPKKGATIKLNKKHSILYKKIIEWELNKSLTLKNNGLWLDKQPLLTYTFTHNYYFMTGDNTFNSYDSRYWGFLPDDFIVGKALLIWKSKNLTTGKYRWNRFMKTIK